MCLPWQKNSFLLLFLCIWFGVLSAQREYLPLPEVEEIFVVSRHVPGFPGCEDRKRGPEKKKCEKEMLEYFLYTNLVYPEPARKKRQEGTVVIRFYVEKDGTVNPEKIMENPGMGMGEEAMRLLELMNRKGLKWSPGNSNVRHHRTLFHLSIDFKLNRGKPVFAPLTLVPIWNASDVYPFVADTTLVTNSAFRVNRIPSVAPVYPGGDTTWSVQEQQQYTSDQLRAYFETNFKFSNADVFLGGEGDFMLKFIVEKDGRVSTVSVNKDPGGGLAAAAVRVIRRMVEEDKRWQPGKREQHTVDVEISIPISLIPKGKAGLVKVKRQQRIIPVQWVPDPPSVLSAPPPPPPPPPQTAASKKKFMLSANTKEPPLFPGCEDMGNYAEEQQCAARKLDEFIQGNLHYPAKAIKQGTSGTALVSFVVEKDGGVSNAEILHDPGAGIGREALRLVRLMESKGLKFSPQKSNVRAYRTLYMLPVNFRLK